MPNPIKLIPAMAVMDSPSRSDTCTITGASVLGSTCFRMILKLLAPKDFAASIYSSSRISSVDARSYLANAGTLPTAMAMAVSSRDVPSATATTMVSSVPGIAIKTSSTRIITVS